MAAWLLAGYLTKRLAKLTTSAHRLASGQYDEPVDVPHGGDEVGLLACAFELMRQRVAETTGALRQERDVLNAVLESTGEGILMTDRKGNSVVSNARWAELVGDAGLAPAVDLISADGEGRPFSQFTRSWLEQPQQEEVADFEGFDPYRRFRCYTAPVRHPDREDGVNGIVIGRIFVLRDVSRETEAERMRSALVSSVSHELRSPLTAIKGYTDTLLDSDSWDPVTERKFLEVVRHSADKLSQLVESLLDAAKAEAGAWRLECEPVRVERIAQQVVTRHRLLSPEHQLDYIIEPKVPLAYADPMRVEQVIANLVDNATKYSPAGSPVVVGVSNGESLTISVTDHGPGIPTEHLPRLFERFYRVNNSVKGLGLGLFICKSLVEAQGGRIWVESEPNQGSTFSFTLPKLADAEQQMASHKRWTHEQGTHSSC